MHQNNSYHKKKKNRSFGKEVFHGFSEVIAELFGIPVNYSKTGISILIILIGSAFFILSSTKIESDKIFYRIAGSAALLIGCMLFLLRLINYRRNRKNNRNINSDKHSQ